MGRTKKKMGAQGRAVTDGEAESHDIELSGLDDDPGTLDEPAGDRDPDARQALESQTVRMADKDWEALEEFARAEQRRFANSATPSSIARRFIQWGIDLGAEGWDALEQIARKERQHTGKSTTAGDVARRYVRQGIRQALPPTRKSVVV